MGKVVSINISKERGTDKNSILEVNLIEGFGLEGDAHGGNWDKQVSIFPLEALEKVPKDKINEVASGGYTENITISGIPLESLTVGSILKIGVTVRVKILSIGKEEYKEYGRPYIVSREGRFGIVIEGGAIKIDDLIEIEDNDNN